jgi:hypothetical protein
MVSSSIGHGVPQPTASSYSSPYGSSATPQSYVSYPFPQEQPQYHDEQAVERHRSLFPASGQMSQPHSTGSSLPQPLGPDAIPGAAAMASAPLGGGTAYAPPPTYYSAPVSTSHADYPQTYSGGYPPAGFLSSYATPGPSGGSNTSSGWRSVAQSTPALTYSPTNTMIPQGSIPAYMTAAASSTEPTQYREQQQSVYYPQAGTVGTLGSSGYPPSQPGGTSGPYYHQPSRGAPQGGFSSPLQPMPPPPAPDSAVQRDQDLRRVITPPPPDLDRRRGSRRTRR